MIYFQFSGDYYTTFLDMLNLSISSNSSSRNSSGPSNDELRLPSEILVEIFSFLSITDRKNARLVCCHWYKAASHYTFLKTEKLVCTREYHDNMKRNFDLLLKSVYCRNNLEFHGLSINRTSIRFWKKRGHQIHVLEFINCTFSKKAAKSVIKCCINLRKLSVQGCSGLISCEVFDHYAKKGVTRSCMESIKIENDADINDYIFKQLFQVYPRVKSIAVSLVNDRFYNTIYKNAYFNQVTKSKNPVYESKSIFSHSAVYEKLRISSDLIQDLEYTEVDEDVTRMHSNFFDGVHNNVDLKLKKIHFSPSCFYNPNHTALSRFFARQDKLEYLVLKNIRPSSQCCSLILNSCLNLRHLELIGSRFIYNTENNSFGPIILFQDVLEKLALSKLKNLKLHFNFRFEQLQRIPNLEVDNCTLRSLCLRSRSLLTGHTSTFIEAFCSLSYLDLNNCNLDDTSMQMILKYQLNLETLILSFNGSITDYGLTGKPIMKLRRRKEITFSISRLKRLNILDLTECSKITQLSVKEMILPNLKFLSLQKCNMISYKGLQSLSKNCPQLEYLDVSVVNVSLESIILLCQKLRSLHFLDLTFCTLDDLSIKIILNSSQSLRFVCYTSGMYYFHIFKKQWKCTQNKVQLEVDGNRVKKRFIYDMDSQDVSRMLSCW